MSEPSFDLAAADRWFAVEFNNRSWDLLELPSRSHAQTEEMLHAAHAAWQHWSRVGNVLHRQRAECLLATAYVAAERVEPAIRYAKSCVSLSESSQNEQTDFDRATAHGCLARALTLAGEPEAAAQQYALASAAADQLTQSGERELFDQLYPPP